MTPARIVDGIFEPNKSVTMMGKILAGRYSMMDVTSSASVHCWLFLRRTYPLVLQRGHTGSSAGRIAVQQEHERSP
ncbi:Uncharacterised protein [Shigella sonnei]|nr:Uncharacterised protein [Shigella sonnei]